MKPIVVQRGFEHHKRTNDSGVEFWYARELMKLLEYSRWEDFEKLIDRAKQACEKSGEDISNHFRLVPKTIDMPKGAVKEVDDYELTRYACYLVTLNGDPRKKDTIAIAQSYFAIQTRKQEIREVAEEQIERLQARGQLSKTEKEFSTLLFDKGFDSREIAITRSEGDRALFSVSTGEMKRRLGIPDNRPLADFLPAVTLNAKALATSLTNHHTRIKDIKNKNRIKENHVENNEGVRQLLNEKGVKPEKLPPELDIKKVERMVKKDEKKKLAPAEKPVKIEKPFKETIQRIANVPFKK
jgi:DNA-damage-inducible protein D